ncbi:MAG: hypothetical protein WC462_04815 [archaeon]
MSIFDFLRKNKQEPVTEGDKILDGAESAEILIPEHARPESKAQAETVTVKKKDKTSSFRIFGVYDIGTEIMVSGIVETGILRKRMKTKINDKDAVLSDIKINSDSVQELLTKEEGKIFLKGKNLYTLKQDDVLEFK